jgi:hypothetical protein
MMGDEFTGQPTPATAKTPNQHETTTPNKCWHGYVLWLPDENLV